MEYSSDTYKSLKEKYPEVIGIKEYAEILGVNRKTITGNPKFKKIMFSTGRTYKVSLSNVAKLVDGK
jgi:hypothetical protein